MDTSSCNPKTPFVKLEDDGQAAILNYSLPQQTAYNATGYLELGLDQKLFKSEETRQTTSPTWDRIDQVKELNTEGIKFAIANDNNLIKNFGQIKSNIRLEQLRLENASKLTLTNSLKTNASLNLTLLKSQVQVASKEVLVRASEPIKVPEENITNLVRSKLLDETLIAQKINKGYLPMAIERFSKKPEVIYISRPKAANPQISIQLNFKMVSFLGDYGAGQTIKTIHLLPGERSTITMRTYKSNETVREQAQNVLDSFSESSADALQDTVERASSHAYGSSDETSNSLTKSGGGGGSIGLNIGFLSIGGGGGGSKDTTEASSHVSATQDMVSNLTNSVDYHVASSDTLRQIEINSETTSRSTTESEESIVREIENINQSRVLNFVFRQLLQEYISITYLDSVSILYYNGFPESRLVAKLPDMDILLRKVLINEDAVKAVQNKIYKVLCNMKDYQDVTTGFIEKVSQSFANCINPEDPADTVTYIRKKLGLEQTAEGYTVPGIIMDVSKRVLRTASAVVDAVLGQGEALDCYNQNLQQSAVKAAELGNNRMEQMSAIEQEQWEQQNAELEQQRRQQQEQWEHEQEKLRQAIKIIDDIEDPAQKAALYKKVFGDCCDVPQSGGCGCVEKPTE